MTSMPYRITSSSWNILAIDKLLFYTLMKGFGAQIPNNFALYHTEHRGAENMRVIQNAKDLKHFLTNDATSPSVVKPVDGIYSKDVRIIKECHSDKEIVILGDGTEINIDDFVREIGLFSRRGALFQELLLPHPVIKKLCGSRICTVRMITTVSDSGAELLYGVWKITVGLNAIY